MKIGRMRTAQWTSRMASTGRHPLPSRRMQVQGLVDDQDGVVDHRAHQDHEAQHGQHVEGLIAAEEVQAPPGRGIPPARPPCGTLKRITNG